MKDITILASILLVSVGPSLINAEASLPPRPTNVIEGASLSATPPAIIYELFGPKKSNTQTPDVKEPQPTVPVKEKPSTLLIHQGPLEVHHEARKPQRTKTQISSEIDETAESPLCTHGKCPKEMEVPRTLEPKQQETGDVESSADDTADSYLCADGECPKMPAAKRPVPKTLEPRQMEFGHGGTATDDTDDTRPCLYGECPPKIPKKICTWNKCPGNAMEVPRTLEPKQQEKGAVESSADDTADFYKDSPKRRARLSKKLAKLAATKTLEPRQLVTGEPSADEEEEKEDEYYIPPPQRIRTSKCRGKHRRTTSTTVTTSSTTSTVTPTSTTSSSSSSTTTSSSSSTSTSTTATDDHVTRTTTVTVTANPGYSPTYILSPYPTTFRKVVA
ncbi:hypothetical protein BDP81DRAFT_467314 [Colletotrichum phormii]|uniref:Uncharacterized protein n=1 Tax=Colletotrichum phormii TaxID=359342 RepID=A0AAJ0A4C8_9PEZI|nr:uncharacterized protein BDP81DRAFT_467314 [Colletotrichum phormii]KAK1655859.1 hypothetical protein BDP81DRAFT_467314 [Colletotrichum phormii]